MFRGPLVGAALAKSFCRMQAETSEKSQACREKKIFSGCNVACSQLGSRLGQVLIGNYALLRE